MTSTPSASAIAIERARRLRFRFSVRTDRSAFSSISSPTMSSPERARRMTDEAAQAALDQQHREEDEQVEDGEGEQLLRGALSTRAVPLVAQPPGKPGHRAAS